MATATAVDIADVVAKMTGMRHELDTTLVDRTSQIIVVQTALVARAHIILHGSPGNAKSMTVDGVLRYLPGVSLFKTQAYKNTTPEQYLGPLSFKAMSNDDYLRKIDGKFADCHIAYIDELPRAPRSVLPAFQGGMVEREFDAGHGPQPIPLMSLIGTSNHVPEDEELQAFFDRFLFKLVVKPPQSQDGFLRILRGGVNRRADPTAAAAPNPDLLVTLDELQALQQYATTITVPESVLEAVAELWANLLGRGIQPSIRRYNDFIAGLQAYAALNGRITVNQDDILLGQHAFWTSEQEIDAVYAEVVKFASEWEREKHDHIAAYDEVRDRLVDLQSQVAQAGDNTTNEMTNTGIDIVKQTGNLRPLIERHIAAAEGRDTTDLQRVLDEMDRAKDYVQQRLLGGLSL